MELELEGLNRPATSTRGSMLPVDGLLNSEVKEEIVQEKKRMSVFGQKKLRRVTNNRSVDKIPDSPNNKNRQTLGGGSYLGNKDFSGRNKAKRHDSQHFCRPKEISIDGEGFSERDINQRLLEEFQELRTKSKVKTTESAKQKYRSKNQSFNLVRSPDFDLPGEFLASSNVARG